MSAHSAAAPAAALAFRSASRSDPGRRPRNEDRVLERPDLGLWAVADGMGGHRDGGDAAGRLLAALAAPSDAPLHGYVRLAELERRAAGVNAELYGEGAGAGGLSGTTLVALLIHERHAAVVWAGDSRAYLMRGGTLTRVSRDHSRVQELVESGALAERRRDAHPDAHVVTRAVGAARRLELERRFVGVEPGDRFLLCSDGLTGCLDDHAIAARLAAADPDEATAALLSAALAAGAADNVSLALVACI